LSEANATKAYNIALRRIKDMIGTDGITNNFQLEQGGKKLFGDKFNGVYTSSKFMKRLSHKKPYMIVNTSPTGSNDDRYFLHWVPIVLLPNNKLIGYDSFGRDIKTILHMKKGGAKFNNSKRDAEQRDEQEDCGTRSLAWLLIYDNWGIETARKI
jgi:hypothetical protein